jgi:hypothetical protein
VAVEFALVLPLLLLLVLGGIDWGYYFFVGEIAANAAREGARAAVVMPGSVANPCNDSGTMPGAISMARNYMQRGGLIAGPGDTRLKAFTCGAGEGCCSSSVVAIGAGGASAELVEVTVRYQVRPGTMSLTGFLPANLLPTAVVARATMRREP